MEKHSILLYIIDGYIEELNEFLKQSNFMFHICHKSCAKITAKNKKEFIKWKKRQDGLLSSLTLQNEAKNLLIEYMQLAGNIQIIAALWELQRRNFLEILSNTKVVLNFTETDLFYFKSNKELYEYWLLYNVLKHGKKGESGKELQKMASRFFDESGQYSLIAYHYDLNVLNINIDDVAEFIECIIEFWKDIQIKLQ